MTAGRRLISWLAVLAWAALIFYLSAQPNLTITRHGILDFILRKSAHMAAFGVLYVFLWNALSRHGARNRPAIAAGGLLTLAYAASDEYHQSFVRGRGAELSDVFIDFAGAVIAAIVIQAIQRRREARGSRNSAGIPGRP